MNIQFCLLPPLINKSESYYESHLQKTLNEINILLTCDKVNTLTIVVYDLIDEFNRVTGELIVQKKRVKSVGFLKNIKSKTQNKNVFYRLFRAIKENETKEQLLNWVEEIGNPIADSFVFVGNHKNKQLTTNVALDYVTKNNTINKSYGSVVIFHRKNEYERCLKRIHLGVSFFVSQIIVDNIHNTNTKKIFNLDIPIYITLTPITSNMIWNMLQGLGVITNNNFIVPTDDVSVNNHLYELMKFVHKEKQYISFEIITHNKNKRINTLVKFRKLLNKLFL